MFAEYLIESRRSFLFRLQFENVQGSPASVSHDRRPTTDGQERSRTLASTKHKTHTSCMVRRYPNSHPTPIFMYSSYFPYSAYSVPTYSRSTPAAYGYARPNNEYLHALAEEEAARRQYADALRAQEEARNRAARARFARHVFENAHSSYASDEEDDLAYGLGYPTRRRYPTAEAVEGQRLAAIERERERERERIRALEEERERRRRLLEEERRRRMILEEEERRLHREAEDKERRRLEQDFLRRQASTSSALSPLEQLLGIRPARSAQPTRDTVSVLPVYIDFAQVLIDSRQPISRRARTMSPIHRPAESSSAASILTDRAASRSPPNERVHININTTTSTPTTSVPVTQRRSSPSPHPPSNKEVDAATKIQTTWRTHHSQRTALQTITELQVKFDALKAEFVLPASLDFIAPGSTTHEHVALPTAGVSLDLADAVGEDDVAHVPKLAYTPTNAPLHAYYEELSRILTRLDGVLSGGHEEVRTRRRELARKVEREAERVERARVLVWRRKVETKENDMDVDTTQASATDGPAEGPARATEVVEEAALAETEMQVEEDHSAPATGAFESVIDGTTSATSTHEQEMSVEPTGIPPLVVDHRSDASESAPHTPSVAPLSQESESKVSDLVSQEWEEELDLF